MIFTDSAFYYGIEITEDNRLLPFDEGDGELQALLTPAKYTISDLASEVSRAMNEVGEQDYAVLVNRKTRVFTIESNADTPTPFDLLVATYETSAYNVLGFSGSNRIGGTSYTGTTAVGSSYEPQFKLQSFVDFEDNQKSIESTVNISASGRVEVVRFGTYKLMECNIKLITNIDQGGSRLITTNLNGVADARRFMEYAVTKGPIEFVPDIKTPGTFNKCILESTPESGNGVDFKLKEEFAKGLVGYYTTGLLVFREVD